MITVTLKVLLVFFLIVKFTSQTILTIMVLSGCVCRVLFSIINRSLCVLNERYTNVYIDFDCAS